MRYELAMKAAREFLEDVRPACVQAEIAGGLRRGKSVVHDIEIVAAPRMRHVGANLFGEPLGEVSLLDEWLAEMVNCGTLMVGPKQGPRFKQFKASCGLMLDVFVVRPPAQWGVIYALRTGPAHYSHWLVTPRNRNGALPSDLRVARGAVWSGLARCVTQAQQDAAIEDGRARLVETPTEESFFALLGIPMPEPGAREPQWGQWV